MTHDTGSSRKEDMKTWKIRDPFAGEFEAEGETLSEAVADAYDDIPAEERPAYVWHGDEQIPVDGGSCTPVE